ncbi:MAG TPA: hypothetical protein VKS00_08470, partial [Candidatus Acidoferrales bacterium]|nr:hypothetical protein [Candidatus Acidoferrales bacterium]
MARVELVDCDVVLNTAEVLHHTAAKERTLAVLIAYMDESGIHEDSAVCAIAGYVGSAEEWRRFEHKWKQALRAESISEFHMSEFESGRRQF